jgi:hypothetical protein
MNRRRPSTLTILVLTLAVITLVVLRHDFWNWHAVKPIAFLPIGLWWQIGVTLLSSLVMWLLVTFAWPAHLEEEAYEAERKRTKNEDGG